jgi:hypothetical protein
MADGMALTRHASVIEDVCKVFISGNLKPVFGYASLPVPLD